MKSGSLGGASTDEEDVDWGGNTTLPLLNTSQSVVDAERDLATIEEIQQSVVTVTVIFHYNIL